MILAEFVEHVNSEIKKIQKFSIILDDFPRRQISGGDKLKWNIFFKFLWPSEKNINVNITEFRLLRFANRKEDTLICHIMGRENLKFFNKL